LAIRKCPQCLTQISPGVAAALSDSIVCPGCKAPLEVAAATRHLAIWAGLAAGIAKYILIARVYPLDQMSLGWAFRVLAAFLAFSITSAVITMFADLRNRTPEPEPAAVSAAHGHGAHH
jgi:hypothetical protein